MEGVIGFSRAVRSGAYVAVAGTASIGEDGNTVGQDDVAAQTRRCFEIALAALVDVGGTHDDVIRTRIMLTDIDTWQQAAAVHGELFAGVRPACTFVEVSRFIRPDWLVEIELDAHIDTGDDNPSEHAQLT
jgi:enamine deaminase RidA (YjgF/YER057c/UK114 family)